MGRLTFLDICSGIGGFRLGLEWAGHKCVGYCEYDKFARASYEAMYDTEGEWKAEDVTKLTPEEIPYADAWCFGFPCFEAGTLVMTDRGYKCIEDIRAGERVLTHKGRFRPVVRPMKHGATGDVETVTEENMVTEAVNNILGMNIIASNTDKYRWLDYFAEHRNIDRLTRNVAVELIDRVKVVDKDTVEVVFSFGDCYKEVLEGLKHAGCEVVCDSRGRVRFEWKEAV